MGLEHTVNRNPIALRVQDVSHARATLEQHGVEFAGDIIDTGVCHMAFVTWPSSPTATATR